MIRLAIAFVAGMYLSGVALPGYGQWVNQSNRSWCLTQQSMWANGEGNRPDMATIRYCADLGVSVLH